MIRARMRRPRRSVSCCSAVYAVARWSLDEFRPLALLIPLPVVVPGAVRSVVGAVVFRRPPSSVNGEMAARNLPCGGACMSPAHVCTPLWGLQGSRAVRTVRGVYRASGFLGRVCKLVHSALKRSNNRPLRAVNRKRFWGSAPSGAYMQVPQLRIGNLARRETAGRLTSALAAIGIVQGGRKAGIGCELRTGTPDATGERGRSSGRGCEAHYAPSPAARWSRTAIPALPSPGDLSMVSAPTCSPLCGLPRLIGSRPSQESVNKRNWK